MRTSLKQAIAVLVLCAWSLAAPLVFAQADASTGGAEANPPARSPATAPTAPNTGAAPAAASSGRTAEEAGGAKPVAPQDPHAANPHAQNPHAAADPHAGMSARKRVVEHNPSLPPGVMVVQLKDVDGNPLPRKAFTLIKGFASVAQGESHTEEKAATDATGQSRFEGLETDTSFFYRVIVKEGSASYATPIFNLQPANGTEVSLVVYPYTRSITEGRIAMRGLVLVEPRDDVFFFELWFQIYSVEKVAWVPEGVQLRLPKGAKAISPVEGASDVRFEERDGGHLALLGTVAPGQHDVRCSFQVPNAGDSEASFDLSLLPHVAEFRVILAASPEMSLEVAGFPPSQVSQNERGNRILITQQRGQGLDRAHIEVGGLPTRGNAPWIAVGLAIFAAGIGLSRSRGDSDEARESRRAEAKQAREVLLRELEILEQNHEKGTIGPRTYEQARLALLSAVGRLLEPKRTKKLSATPDS